MWHLIRAECLYQKRRAIGFLAGVVVVATVLATLNDVDHPGEYFIFPSLLLFAGILMHVTTLWDADSEKRETLHAQLPISRVRAAGAKMLAPVAFQMIGLIAALICWIVLIWSGAVDDDPGIEAFWFLVAGNGAALAFLLGWVHLGPEVDRVKQRSPWLAWIIGGLAVSIVLGVTAWTFSPSPLDSPLAISFGVAAAIFYPLAAVVAALKLWLYVRRDELAA